MSYYEQITGEKAPKSSKKKKKNETYYEQIINSEPITTTATKQKQNIVEDIAPVKSTTNTISQAKNVLESMLGIDRIKDTWSNGYQFGDVSQTILNVQDMFNPQNKVAQRIADSVKSSDGKFLKSTKTKEELKDIWSNGYQFGDIAASKNSIAKTILGSTADVVANAAKGELQTAEGLVDFGRYAGADYIDVLGFDKAADKIRQKAVQNTTGVIFGENTANNYKKENGWLSKVDEYSVFGDKMDNITQSVGQQAFRIGLSQAIGQTGLSEGTVNTLNQLEIFTGSYGSAKSEALANGADNATATLRGAISGTAEWISENMFDAIPGFKTGELKSASSLKDLIAKGAEKALGKGTGKYIIRGINSLGEGVEEGVSNGLETMGTDIVNALAPQIASLFGKDYQYTYGMQEGQGLNQNSFGKNFKKLFKDAFGSTFSKESGEAFLVAAISTLITGGFADGMTNAQRNQVINQYAKENNISKEKATKLFDGIRDLRLKQRVDSTTGYEQRMEMQDQATKQLAQELKQGAKSGQKIDLQELFDRTPKTRKESQFIFTDDEVKGVKSEQQKRLATEMQGINNEEDVHNKYRTLNAMQGINDTVQYHPATTEKLYELGFINKNAKGEYTMKDGSKYIPRGLTFDGNNIYVNFDVGEKSATQAMYHEMFESFKATSPKQYNTLKQMVVDIVGQDTIDNELAEYKKMYGKKLTDNITDEIINDKFGELAENQQFINRIADNRSVLEKLIDSVKNMIKYVKGTPEERQLMKLQKNLETEFAKRYKETDFSKNNVEGETAYALFRKNKNQNIDYNFSQQLVDEIDRKTRNANKNNKDVKYVRVEDIYPLIDRKGERSVEQQQAFVDYIKQNGINEPIIITNNDGVFEIADGNHRLEFAHNIGLQEVPVVYDSFFGNVDFDSDEWYTALKESLNEGRTVKTDEGSQNEPVNNNRGVRTINNRRNNAENDRLYSKIQENDDRSSVETTPSKNIARGKKKAVKDTAFSLTSAKDSQGRNLTPQQQEYFKDSKVVDENGNLLEVYHGQNSEHYTYRNPGNKFNNDFASNKMFEGTEITMFTSSEEIADSYIDNEDNPNMKPVKAYLNITNPYIVDAKNQSNQYFLDNDGTPTNVNNLVKRIYDSGEYDGVIIKNVADIGEYYEADITDGRQYATDYIVFNSNQIKSVDNTNPTSNEDIRYSLTTNKDSNGKTLTKEQQNYFKDTKIVDNEGNLLEVYRGEPTIGKTTYEMRKGGGNKETNEYGIYFTNSKDFAKDFSFERIEDPNDIFFVKKGKEGEVKSAYLNITNPLDLGTITEEEIRNLYPYASSMAKQITDEEKFVSDMLNWQQIGNHQLMKSYLDMKEVADNTDYDGLVAKLNVQGNELEYAVFNSNQIKSTDNLNPTSNEDIRYSLAPTGEMVDNEGNKVEFEVSEIDTELPIRDENKLMVLHNLGENKMNGIMDLDGIPSPSIAITNPYKVEHSNFGEGTLIFKKDTIDPANRLNEVYDRDVWSPTQPEIEYEILENKLDEVANNLGIEYWELLDYTKRVQTPENLVQLLNNNETIKEKVDNGLDLAKEVEKIYGEKGIRNDKDYLTPTGNRRSFWQLHEKYNLDNLVKALTKGKTKGTQKFFPGYGQIQSKMAQRYKSIDDIKAHENLIQELNTDNPNQVLLDARARIENDIDQIVANNDTDYLVVSELLADFADGKMTIDNFKKLTSNYYQTTQNVSDELIQKTIDDLNNLKNLPTKYFEAKPQRAVGLDEIGIGLIPQTWSDNTKQRMKDKGIKYIEYDSSIPGERQRIEKELTDYMFSLTSNQNIDSKEIAPVNTTTDEMIAPIREDISNLNEKIDNLSNQIETLQNPYQKRAREQREATERYEQLYKDENYLKSFEESTKKDKLEELPIKKKTRKEVRENLQSEMGITIDDLQVGNDIKSMSYNLTTPERVNEKVFGREVGRKINDQTVNFAKHQEAERVRFLNKERNEIADLGIKARSKESALVQQYGEGLIDNVQLEQAVSDKATQEKIKKAAKFLRNKYDTYLDQINEELVDMGYDPIPKRKDYMRHFQELSDKFSQAGIPFNRQALNSENLPTDINGLTEFNVPGKNWFASAQRRTGEKTTYDAITGIDGYLEGASNLMYHTETIQRYRALEKLIRDTYGQQHGLDQFGEDLSSEEAMQRIQDIQEGKLSNYAAWLKEQGNALAGKKGALDRGFERALGRRAYTLASELKKQVGSNMTGFNVRSALTNFISSTIAASKTNKIAMIKGTVDTIRNMFNDDGFIDRSDFLTSRLRNDSSLSKKTWQKISNAGQILMSGSDWFTSNLITRSKYYEGIQRGMTEEQAMRYANDFAARVMGDRSKGATAEAFNSKTLGFLTQFQLETNNQWQYMIHDTKMEYQENLAKEGGLKAGATVLFQMGQLAAYSYLFNEMFEQLTGSRAAFDIADILKKLFGLDDDDKDKTFEERMKEAGSELVDALPFASLFGSGGRLPIGEMLTPAQTLYDYLTGGTNKYGQEITLKDVSKDTLEALPYYVLPTGYGQIKKTAQGLGMYANEVPGSYTDSGNLRFTADTDTGSVIKNALFGQWAGKEAKKYRESGYKTIKSTDIQEMQDLNMNSSEYREYKENLKEAGTKNADKLDYINSLNIPINEKNIMASNVVDRPVDMSNYTTYEEFDFAYKNPGKYKAMTAIANDYQSYQTYMAGIEDVRDKYSQTKGYSTEQRKQKVISYVNTLNLTVPQKAMLLRQYYSSFKKYNKEIVNYVASLDLDYQDKVEILQSLKMKVDKDGNVSW